MKKKDLKDGMVIETLEGNQYLIKNGYNPLGLNCVCNLIEKCINEDLTNEYKRSNIIKVYEDYTLKKVLWERKEKPKLTEDEKVILRNLPKKYKYIVRDKNETLYIYMDKPKKESLYWDSANFCGLGVFEHLFQFIKWEDEEPYLISDLLEEDK